MNPFEFEFKSKVWKYEGPDSWYFVNVGKSLSSHILSGLGYLKRGWSSFRVTVQINDTTWQTSIFLDKSRGFILPLKKSIRKELSIGEGDILVVSIELVH